MNLLIQYLKKLLKYFNIYLMKSTSYERMMETQNNYRRQRDDVALILDKLTYVISSCAAGGKDQIHLESFLKFAASRVKQTKSQIFQDLFVLYMTNEKRNGFFVEFGATNGVELSNTHLLEMEYGWTGILAEPAKCWRKNLEINRSCKIDLRCVWKKSGDLVTFHETTNAELSYIGGSLGKDNLDPHRTNMSQYQAATVSLNDLLAEHDAPTDIDYLSIDTEGSEYEILKAFNFEKYSIKIITVEHNFTANRSLIYSLLSDRGYIRVFDKISLFDDWYILIN